VTSTSFSLSNTLQDGVSGTFKVTGVPRGMGPGRGEQTVRKRNRSDPKSRNITSAMNAQSTGDTKPIDGEISLQCYQSRTDEAALIRKIVGGHRNLFGDLIAPHLTVLSRMVQATIGGHPEVEDIVQKTVLKAFTHLEQFRFEAAFRTWLIQIALNEARQWRRTYARSRYLEFTPRELSELPIADPSHSPLVECLRSETDAQLGAALARLPAKYRNVILLRDFEGLSISEAAARLGLTIGAVKSRHVRARRKAAGFLEPLKSFGRVAALSR
jgi:RNA polymerase sigma-70 factor, ECF subfamily